MTRFYSYLWLSVDGRPYYVGKGSGDRAFEQHQRRTFCSILRPVDPARIIIFPQVSEADALRSERDLIALFGRENLLNRNDGGGRNSDIHTIETRLKIGRANTRAAYTRRRIAKAVAGRKWALVRWGAAI